MKNLNQISGADTINNNIEPNIQLKTMDVRRKLETNQRKLLNSDQTMNATNKSTDDSLEEWLISHNIDTNSIDLILSSQFSYDDFIYATEKDDIRRLGLK